MKARSALHLMEATLEEVLEYLDDEVDVVDGDYGIPAPNKAMRLTTEIKDVLRKVKEVVI